MNETRKPVYLDEKPGKTFKEKVAIGTVLLVVILCALAFFVKLRQSDDRHDETCDLLLIAFDEAQMAPGWYESAGKALQACGKSIDQEDITAKACFANRWNGYETDECTAFEKSRQ